MGRKTVKNFLVGIGYDYDKKGEREMGSGISSLKSKYLALGKVVAGAFGFKKLTVDFANAKDTLSKFSEVLGVDASRVNAFGNALSHEGGSLESFMSQLENLEKLRAGLLTGDANWMAAAGAAGIDSSEIIDATDSLDAYMSLADQFAAMTTQQRINAAGAIGLDDSSIRLLSMGREELEKLVDAEERRRPITEEMTDEAKRFNDEMQDLSNNIGGIADKISSKLLPAISDFVEETNDFIENSGRKIDLLLNAWNLNKQEAGELLGTDLPDYLFKPIGDLNQQDYESMRQDYFSVAEDFGDYLTNAMNRISAEYVPGGSTERYISPTFNSLSGISPLNPTLGIPGGNSPINITIPVVLDGKTIENKVIEVNSIQNKNAFDNIKTNVGG